MNKPVAIFVVGVVLLSISLTADIIGIGEGTGIGWKQIAGITVGLIIAALGMAKMRKNR